MAQSKQFRLSGEDEDDRYRVRDFPLDLRSSAFVKAASINGYEAHAPVGWLNWCTTKRGAESLSQRG